MDSLTKLGVNMYDDERIKDRDEDIVNISKK
jgi:hypothetical protein